MNWVADCVECFGRRERELVIWRAKTDRMTVTHLLIFAHSQNERLGQKVIVSWNQKLFLVRTMTCCCFKKNYKRLSLQHNF